MISKCKILHVLKVQHISFLTGECKTVMRRTVSCSALIFIRCSILDLIGIDPSTLRVHFHPGIEWGEYQKIDGDGDYLVPVVSPECICIEDPLEGFQKARRGDLIGVTSRNGI